MFTIAEVWNETKEEFRYFPFCNEDQMTTEGFLTYQDARNFLKAIEEYDHSSNT